MNDVSNYIPVLTGDIGGTNSRLEVIHLSKVILILLLLGLKPVY